MLSATVAELVDVVARLDIAVDGDDLIAVTRARDLILAKSMTPLREFNERQLYQLSKAASTKEFLEVNAGLASPEAGFVVGLARKLTSGPFTPMSVNGRWISSKDSRPNCWTIWRR